MERFTELLPFIIPIIVLQFLLLAAALFDLARRDRTRGPKWAWALIIIFVNVIGPIIYFAAGREE
jgi:hypothetical protein